MALYLAETKEHALIALTIQEATQAAAGQAIGRTALMKMLYFLRQSEGRNSLAYRFEMYHYGPFCSEVLRDVDWLKADGVIKDESPDGGQSNFKLAENADELFSLHSDLIEEWRPKVKKVANVLAPLPTADLEILSTLDFLFRQQVAINADQATLKARVLDQFESHKPNKYTKSRVAELYDIMTQQGVPNLF